MKKCVFLYEADHVHSIVYVDVESMKRAGQITNDEFSEYVKIKETLPGYTFKVKEFPKKIKRTYGGLTMKVMQAFIIQHEDNIAKAESQIRKLNDAKSKRMLNSSGYGAAKSWFLDNYGEEYNHSNMSKKDSKRDALIKELLAKVDSSLIDPAAEADEKGDA